MNYYDIMKLPHEDAELLVGNIIYIDNRLSLVISLDDYYEHLSGFSTKYTVIQVSQNPLYNTLQVYIPGIDDTNFNCYFPPNANLYLSLLTDKVLEWAKKLNYRNINLHALKDYLAYLTTSHGIHHIEIDWN